MSSTRPIEPHSDFCEWTARLMPGQIRHLFDHLPGTLFFVKNREGRLMTGNPAFLKRCGFETEDQIAGMSVRQFERKFRATFQMTPRDYLIRMRVIAACELLARTSTAMTDVALECGFYDHSDFARQFRRQMNQTATRYRNEHRAKGEAGVLPDFRVRAAR